MIQAKIPETSLECFCPELSGKRHSFSPLGLRALRLMSQPGTLVVILDIHGESLSQNRANREGNKTERRR